MEEAEALADRAGIMNRRMLAVGTVGHLRQRYGDSYTIHLVSRSAPHTSDEEMERLRRWVVGNFADAVLEDKPAQNVGTIQAAAGAVESGNGRHWAN